MSERELYSTKDQESSEQRPIPPERHLWWRSITRGVLTSLRHDVVMVASLDPVGVTLIPLQAHLSSLLTFTFSTEVKIESCSVCLGMRTDISS